MSEARLGCERAQRANKCDGAEPNPGPGRNDAKRGSAVSERSERTNVMELSRIQGQAVPAVLVPGLISGDVSMTILSRHLRRHGHRTFRSAIGANLGCTDAMVDRLITRLEAVVTAEGGPVDLVGHSRGGMIVKLVARRRPDLVAGIV